MLESGTVGRLLPWLVSLLLISELCGGLTVCEMVGLRSGRFAFRSERGRRGCLDLLWYLSGLGLLLPDERAGHLCSARRGVGRAGKSHKRISAHTLLRVEPHACHKLLSRRQQLGQVCNGGALDV